MSVVLGLSRRTRLGCSYGSPRLFGLGSGRFRACSCPGCILTSRHTMPWQPQELGMIVLLHQHTLAYFPLFSIVTSSSLPSLQAGADAHDDELLAQWVPAITPQAPPWSLLSQACLAPPNDHPLPADTQSLFSPTSNSNSGQHTRLHLLPQAGTDQLASSLI